jgi:hypothetical protein
MDIELPGGGRFEEALAREQGWPVGFAERVTDEYRRFLYLAAIADTEVTPSHTVDEAWHLHLTSPHYEELLCRRILGRPLRHLPAAGEPGEEERHRRQYAGTVALYGQVFGRAPPADIWPRPVSKKERAKAGWPRRRQRLAFGFALASLALSAGVQAIGLTVVALVAAGGGLVLLLLALPTHPAQAGARNPSGGGCGGVCGGGASGHGGGCGASCGGGCGGGCGGD